MQGLLHPGDPTMGSPCRPAAHCPAQGRCPWGRLRGSRAGRAGSARSKCRERAFERRRCEFCEVLVAFAQSVRAQCRAQSAVPLRDREEGSRPVSRVLSRAIIPLGRPSPNASSSLPGSRARTRRCRIAPATSLFGLAPGGVCHATRCCHPRGALLPHHFTLTSAARIAACRASAVSFCCTFRGLAPPRGYLAPCPSEPGLSSPFR